MPVQTSHDLSPANANRDDGNILTELEVLVKETFDLWDQIRVGFSWRTYYFDHTQRVRAMCKTLGDREGGDVVKLEYAALLHDITKRYDGGIVTDAQGNRIVDEKGYWKNDLIMPNPRKSNVVTEIYHANNCYGKLHSISGATVARELLKDYGFSQDFREDVASIIEAHLGPGKLPPAEIKRRFRKTENRILYDADTIDANLGMTAFYRNIQIHAHRIVSTNGRFDLAAYVDGLPRWINMKHDFLGRMLSDSGREIAQTRQDRKHEIHAQLCEEKKDWGTNVRCGMLGIIDYFASQCADPDLQKEMDYLAEEWLTQREEEISNSSDDTANLKEALKRARKFHYLLSEEIAGRL